MKTYHPTKAVSKEACKALDWHKKFGSGLTPVGIKRASQLCKKQPVSHKTVKRMDNFFNRHSAFKKYHTTKPKPSNSLISWKAWGGNPGRSWAKKILRGDN